jgi:hypothetical protein
MKGKLSQGHVEMMISFVIFIGFLLFIFLIINPFSKSENKPMILDKLQEKILNNISSKVGKLSIFLGNSSDCYDFNEDNYGVNSVVHYKETVENEGMYNIYFSDIFDGNFQTKKGCSPQNYKLGIYSEEEMIVYEKVLSLKQTDYDLLKKNFGIKNNFLISFKYIDGPEIPELTISKSIPKGINVDSKEIPVRVINKNGDVLELIMNIKAW